MRVSPSSACSWIASLSGSRRSSASPDCVATGDGTVAASSALRQARAVDTAPVVDLRPVDASSWRAVADVAPRPDQERWVTPVTRYLCLCLFEREWHPMAVRVGDEVVGFLMWGFDPDERSHCIGGVVIDAAHQGKGIGRGVITSMLRMFEGLDGYREAALTIHPDNTVARRLYASLGFVETGEESEGELVARRPRAPVTE